MHIKRNTVHFRKVMPEVCSTGHGPNHVRADSQQHQLGAVKGVKRCELLSNLRVGGVKAVEVVLDYWPHGLQSLVNCDFSVFALDHSQGILGFVGNFHASQALLERRDGDLLTDAEVIEGQLRKSWARSIFG